jgi:hypothetical protein
MSHPVSRLSAMTVSWADLEVMAGRGATAQIRRRFLDLDETARLAFAAELDAGIRRSRPDSWWERGGNDPAGGYALAVIACARTAAQAATMLGRRGMRDGWASVPVADLRTIAEARGLTWLPDLGVRLAGRLPARDVRAGEWRFVAALLAGAPELAPPSEGFVRGWLAHLHETGGPRRAMAGLLRDDPFLDTLLPAVFEVEGLGGALGGTSYWTGSEWTAEPAFVRALPGLVAEGRLDRGWVLGATLDRMVRGDRPGWLRPFVLLHDGLAPAVDEMAGHAESYGRLLALGASPVTGLAQRCLRAVDEAGRLDLDLLIETSAAVLARPEKTLVKTQLSWLATVVRREPARAGELLSAVEVAFGHPSLDVQDRARKLAGRLDPGATAAPPVSDLPVVPPAPPPAVMPPPIGDAAELAAEVVALLHDETAVGWERVLAALVTVPADEMRVALRPVLHRHQGELTGSHRSGPVRRSRLLGAAIRAVLTPPAAGGDAAPDALRDAWIFAADDRRSLRGGPGSVLDLRIREIADRITAYPAGALMATPTLVSGSLDAAVLLERLIRAEAGGWTPWPVDFEQALLRVPRDIAPDVLDRAAGLTSFTGRRFATWLKNGGNVDPVSTRHVQVGRLGRYSSGRTPRAGRRVMARLDQVRGDSLLEEGLFNLARGDQPVYFPDNLADLSDVTIAVLPQHREVTAAWALPGLAAVADLDDRGGAAGLPLLAECGGPVGPALTAGLVYALGARHEPDRVAAIDAFLVLAGSAAPSASGLSIGAAVGAELGDLGADGTVKLTRVALAVADLHRAGATAEVWQLMLAALPGLLATGPRGLPDLLEIATRVAGEAGARDEIGGLAEVAGRSGSSRLVTEARRLLTVTNG